MGELPKTRLCRRFAGPFRIARHSASAQKALVTSSPSFYVTAVPGGCTPMLDGAGCTMISALLKRVVSSALGAGENGTVFSLAGGAWGTVYLDQ
jgi:hypothetical protein